MNALLLLNQAMDAAGMEPEADPELLPDRIRELRFVGNTFVAKTGGLEPQIEHEHEHEHQPEEIATP
jgi:hypothetical protein